MPRQPRRKSNTGIYHIMLRGINRQSIFEDDHDRRKFVKILEKYREEVTSDERNRIFDVFAWVIMGNHVHLVLRFLREDSDIQHVMKRICVAYSIYYNRKNARIGPVFQDRYRSEPIEDEGYLFNAVRYVHMNPVKAGLCDNPMEYVWSSYREYMHKKSVARIVGLDAGTLVSRRIEGVTASGTDGVTPSGADKVTANGTDSGAGGVAASGTDKVIANGTDSGAGGVAACCTDKVIVNGNVSGTRLAERHSTGTNILETVGVNEAGISDQIDRRIDMGMVLVETMEQNAEGKSNRKKIDELTAFENLTMEEDDGIYLEMCQERKRTMSDDAVREEMKEYGCSSIEEFRKLRHDEKVSCICFMHDKGAGLAQISRVTGISRPTVRKMVFLT